MGKKGARSGAKGGARSIKKAGPTGIEKYGKDQVDEFLDLDAGENDASEESSAVCEEEDVMALDAAEDEDELDWEPPKRSAKVASVGKDEDEEENFDPGSKGWRRDEFYGGESGGGDSDEDSDEDIIFNEAKRLEEIRAQQLTGEVDVLAALLATPGAAGAGGPASTQAGATAKIGSVPVSAHFESVFAGEAEQVSVAKDISELTLSERKSLLKKEAPELMPLLSDFKAKLSVLQELLPLLQPAVLKKLPASGAAYLEAKAALLLNTLANLSFYLLLRAEGGAVRAHPVVPQLVWLRELHEQLAPMDKKLGKKMRKALVAAGDVLQASETGPKAGDSSDSDAMGMQTASAKRGQAGAPAPRKKTLRERLEKMHFPAPTAAGKKDAGANLAALSKSFLTKDLLRLPKARHTGANAGNASAPTDLDDIDPSLGVWAPSSSVGEQISAVQQQFREHASRAAAAATSAEQNVEARPRKARERKDNLHKDPERDEPPRAVEKAGDEDDDDLIKNARLVGKAKKEAKTQSEIARAEHKEEQRRLREFKPEPALNEEGRRKTSKRILDNRGLHRVRKKYSGNARVANKGKYEKSLKRRKGAVQDMREGAADGATYEGEATGVRTHVRKSQKIG